MAPAPGPILRAALLLTFVALLQPRAGRAADSANAWVEVRSAHFVVASNADEKEARRIAGQFEQIRAMFQTAFTTLRVDPPQSIVILAAKNENTMKQLLPEEWEVKGHIHHAGIYQPGEDKDYVILRLDGEGNNPYHTLYHEYTHALLRLNFSGLPLWLDEGLAEFFGNSTLGEKESKTGTIDESHLYILSRSKLLPIEMLLGVDHSSPYYNETDRASVFYAESWALVHYLMLDPEAQQKQLLTKFLNTWEKSGNQVDAARESFGDLKRFGQIIEGYARQTTFRVGVVKSPKDELEKSFAARALSPGEVLALRGDFFAHHDRLEPAQPLLEQAVQAEPKLAMAHEALGFWKYRKQDFGGASKEMEAAVQLGSNSFSAAYYRGMTLLQGPADTDELAQEAVKSLERATQINPQFAPAFEGLAHAYSRSPETQKQAVNAALRAVKLDPGTHRYAFNLAYLLLNDNRDGEARVFAQKLVAAAHSPEEAQKARELVDRIREHEQWVAQNKALAESAGNPASGSPAAASSSPGGGATPVISSQTGIPVKAPKDMGVDGIISRIDCSRSPEITITLALSKGPMTFHAADARRISVSAPSEAALPSLERCKEWKGRQAKVWFRIVQGQEYLGEILRIYFD
jgi:tetratricopeptide (TPR) repeat protein